jgi:tetratricopeptide (TPR) repeat protein
VNGPSPVEQKLQRAAAEILGLIQGRDTAKAFQKISAFRGDALVTRFTLIRLLVSAGQQNRDRAVLTCALDAFERLKSKAKGPLGPETYYDIANGYLELFALAVHDDGTNVFSCEDVVAAAQRYGERGAADGPRALTNLGNLYDETGRPVEALRCYERALAIDPEFGMALGNKAMAIQTLASVTEYTVTHLIQAHQLYEAAIERAESVAEAGLDGSLESFREHDEAIVSYLTSIGRADRLDQDLRHEPYDDSGLSEFVRFYTRFSLEHDLYLNTHLADRTAEASIGDEIVPPLVTRVDDSDDRRYVDDIMFRLNEILESYMTARMALVQSQYLDDDFSVISRQTSLINLEDGSASNIYVGHLKMAYKEAFAALDKIAVLLNHYLELGLPEQQCYYGTVWYEHGPDGRPTDPRVVAAKITAEGHRLFGLYLLCKDLCGSKYSDIRNALTHRYLRVYTTEPKPRRAYLFDEMTATTTEVLYKVKCAIMYAALFVWSKENQKGENHPTVQAHLNTNQLLDQWSRSGLGASAATAAPVKGRSKPSTLLGGLARWLRRHLPSRLARSGATRPLRVRAW